MTKLRVYEPRKAKRKFIRLVSKDVLFKSKLEGGGTWFRSLGAFNEVMLAKSKNN